MASGGWRSVLIPARSVAPRRSLINLRREPLVLAATSVLAIAVPVGASRYLAGRVAALGPRLSALTGEPSSVGGVEAGLTGEVRLGGVEIGDVLRVDAIEASVAMSSLLSGELGADEIRLERPRLRAYVDGAGESNLARIVRRVAARRAAQPRGNGGRRLRRIVVTEGALVLDVVGIGHFEARGVELHPQRGGVRVVTGAVRGDVAAGPLALAATFARGGGDLALPEARLARFLVVGGRVEARPQGGGGSAALPIEAAALGWNVWGDGVLGLRGEVDGRGVAHPVIVTARPRDGAAHVRGTDVPLGWLASLAPAGVGLADARATGTVTLARTAGGWSAVGDAAIDGLVIDSRAISDAPFPIDAHVAIAIEGDRSVLDVRSVEISRGALQVAGHGRVRRGGPAGLAAGELELAVREARCLDLVAALPPAMRGPLGAMSMDGRAAATLRLAFDLDAPPGEGVELDADVAAGCAVLADPPEADVHALARVTDHAFPDGSRAPVGPGVGDWVALIALPAHVDGAFVAAEDSRFFDHRGFDLQQIARSLEVDLREGRFARGGSTISQQLVKNAFLTQRRTLDRKLQEAVLTWRLESTLSKRQILERYLNVIELGPGVYGVAAAARHWFGKPAVDLTIKEAALLAAMTPEPRSMSARLQAAGGLDAQSAERVDTVLRHMEHAGLITAWQRDAARREPLAFRRDAVSGPHLSRR